MCEKGIGKLKHIRAKIDLDDNATPRFHKARPVPYALRAKVDAKLLSLEESKFSPRLTGATGLHLLSQ